MWNHVKCSCTLWAILVIIGHICGNIWCSIIKTKWLVLYIHFSLSMILLSENPFISQIHVKNWAQTQNPNYTSSHRMQNIVYGQFKLINRRDDVYLLLDNNLFSILSHMHNLKKKKVVCVARFFSNILVKLLKSALSLELIHLQLMDKFGFSTT